MEPLVLGLQTSITPTPAPPWSFPGSVLPVPVRALLSPQAGTPRQPRGQCSASAQRKADQTTPPALPSSLPVLLASQLPALPPSIRGALMGG